MDDRHLLPHVVWRWGRRAEVDLQREGLPYPRQACADDRRMHPRRLRDARWMRIASRRSPLRRPLATPRAMVGCRRVAVARVRRHADPPRRQRLRDEGLHDAVVDFRLQGADGCELHGLLPRPAQPARSAAGGLAGSGSAPLARMRLPGMTSSFGWMRGWNWTSPRGARVGRRSPGTTAAVAMATSMVTGLPLAGDRRGLGHPHGAGDPAEAVRAEGLGMRGDMPEGLPRDRFGDKDFVGRRSSRGARRPDLPRCGDGPADRPATAPRGRPGARSRRGRASRGSPRSRRTGCRRCGAHPPRHRPKGRARVPAPPHPER